MKGIPCPVLLKEEPDTFLVLFKNEQKWIFRCSKGYGEIRKNGDAIYYLFNGKFYREDGPAVEWHDGTKFWYKNGKKHRIDGPACELNNGYREWWIEDKNYFEKEYLEKIEEMKRDGTYSL